VLLPFSSEPDGRLSRSRFRLVVLPPRGLAAAPGHVTHRRVKPGPPPTAGFLQTGTRGFAPPLQARHTSPTESSSLSYGRAVHLPLLPTVPGGATSHCSQIAVMFGYKLRQL
jgi:hypothetical protein